MDISCDMFAVPMTTIFFTIYTSVKRASFTNSNELVVDMTLLQFMTSYSCKPKRFGTLMQTA